MSAHSVRQHSSVNERPAVTPTGPAILTEPDVTGVRKALEEHGAVLVRARVTIDDFEALSDALMRPMVHHSTSKIVERDPVNADATTATVNKGMDYIPLHREGSYAPGCPDLLMLHCVRPADAAGETTLCDGVQLQQTLPSRIREFVEDAVLLWSWQVSPERWMATLGVRTKEEAEARLQRIPSTLHPWEKLDAHFEGDTLHGVFQTLCVIPTRWGGRKSFCNSLLIYHYREGTAYYPKSIYTPALGDGSPFPLDMLDEIAEHARAQTYDLTWQEGDILLIDNSRFMHGRRAFTDTERRILARMGHMKGGVQ